MKVVVLMGGRSSERDVSLRSGQAIAQALKKKGHEVHSVDAAAQDLVLQLMQLKPESVFIALHGKYGEDGTAQGLLEWLGLPYTGPSVSASSVCYDKALTKSVLKSIGIRMPLGMECKRGEDIELWFKRFSMSPIPFPLIVKPSCEGSSIGVSRVYKIEELKSAIEEGLKLHEILLIEELIEGREITVGVFNGKPLPIVEVKPKSGFYNFESKYTAGKTEYLVPAPLNENFVRETQECCRYIYSFLKLEGAVRMDFMINAKMESHFLEVNTIPGMTETSLLPKAAKCSGVSFEDLCDEILKTARLKI